MAKEKENKFENYSVEDLQKQIKVCKNLRLVFIIVGVVLTLGGGFLFFYGYAHVIAAILAIVLSGGHADISEIMGAAGIYMYLGGPLFLLGLVIVIAGPIVTSVKLKHRKKELLRRGEVL